MKAQTSTDCADAHLWRIHPSSTAPPRTRQDLLKGRQCLERTAAILERRHMRRGHLAVASWKGNAERADCASSKGPSQRSLLARQAKGINASSQHPTAWGTPAGHQTVRHGTTHAQTLRSTICQSLASTYTRWGTHWYTHIRAQSGSPTAHTTTSVANKTGRHHGWGNAGPGAHQCLPACFKSLNAAAIAIAPSHLLWRNVAPCLPTLLTTLSYGWSLTACLLGGGDGAPV